MMDWKRYIVVDPKVLNGQPHFKGTQFTVQHILEKIASGMTMENIVEEYPALDEATVRADLKYAVSSLDDHFKNGE